MEVYQGVCRLCLGSEQVQLNIFVGGESVESYSKWIFDSFRIKLKETKNWPVNACTGCVRTLDAMQELKSKIKSTQKQLFHLNIKSAVAAIQIKMEPKDQLEIEFIDPNMLSAKEEGHPEESKALEAVEMLEAITENEDAIPSGEPTDDALGDDAESQGSVGDVPADQESEEAEADESPTKRRRTEKPSITEEESENEESDSDYDPEEEEYTEKSYYRERREKRKLVYNYLQSKDPSGSRTSSRIKETGPYAEVYHQTGMLKCHLCARDHETYKMLAAHTRRHHQCQPNVTCFICKRSIRSWTEIEDHAKYHLDKSTFTCSACQKQCRSGRLLKVHQIGVHQLGEADFNCDQCGRKHVSISQLRSHMKVHLDSSEREIFPCTQCDKKYKSAPSLLDHVLNVHEKEKNFVCDVCGKSYATKNSWLIHTQDHTRDKTKTQCDICLQYVSNVSKHKQRKHTTKEPIQCQECNKPIAAAYFRSHTKDIHGERKEFPCAICGKLFYSQKTWKVHMDLHAGVVYPCRVCGREFGNQGNRTKHERAKHSVEFQQLRKKPATTSPLN